MGNPKIRCDVCGRAVSQYHLKRHRGTVDCVREHYLDLARREHAIEAGFAPVSWNVEKFLWWAFGLAGFDPKTTPLKMGVYWPDSVAADSPAFGSIAPTWAAQAAWGVSNPKLPAAMDVVVLAQYLHKDESAKSIEARLGLATEIELTCVSTSSRGHRTVHPDKVLRVLRRWASAVMGGAFPDS